jgi:hypothetical protein
VTNQPKGKPMKNVTMRVLAAGAALGAALLLNAPANAQDQGQYGQGGRGGWGQAQGQRQDPGQRLDRQVAMLTQRLRLSGSQASQIREILQQEQEQMQAWRQDHGGDPRDGQNGQGRWQRDGQNGQGGWQRDGQGGQRGGRQGAGQRRQLPPELQAIRDRSEQQVERVLNSSQRAQYHQLRAEREQRGGERGQDRAQWGNGQR